MHVSVITPTYNRPERLRQCLAALQRQTYPDFECIVVDDGASEATRDLVAQAFPQVRYQAQAQQGPAAARNLGLSLATGEIVAFTDDDCETPPDWLARLVDGYARYPHVVGVGGGLIAPPEVLRTNVYAQYEYYLTVHQYHVGAAEVVGGFECPAGGSANMSYTRAVLESVQGFDQRFPVAAGEDADLKLRITQPGHQLLYVPTWVLHRQEYSWARFRRQCYLRGVGRNYFEARHGGGAPSRAKIALRAVRRLLDFPLDLVRMRRPRLALVKLADGLITCQGQWAGR